VLFRLGALVVGVDILFWLAGAFADMKLRLTSAGCSAKDNQPVEAMSTRELRELLHIVLSVHGYQVFFCPLFNADPHPGNILLLPDGRIGLIDFGQCRQLSHDQRLAMAQLVVVLSEPADTPGQDTRVAAAFAATGIKTKNSDERFLAMMPRLMFCGLKPEWLDRDRLREIFENDRIVSFPTHMIMLYRTSMLLRGTCLALQENVDISEAWRPWAERWLKEHAT
jgi:aarF domain-containing kinase